MSFSEWTVLPHDPIVKHEDNLWSVSGTMPKGNQRRMTVIRLQDGRLILHNAIALDDAEMQELESFGTVAAIVVPNAFHRQDARIFKARYPEAKVYAPAAAVGKVSKIAAVDGDFAAIPGDDTVSASHLAGMKDREGVVIVRSSGGTTAIFNDALLNMERKSGVAGFFMGPTGRPSVPRFTRWLLLKDKAALIRHLRTIATDNLKRVIFGHGPNVEQNGAAVLQAVADELQG